MTLPNTQPSQAAITLPAASGRSLAQAATGTPAQRAPGGSASLQTGMHHAASAVRHGFHTVLANLATSAAAPAGETLGRAAAGPLLAGAAGGLKLPSAATPALQQALPGQTGSVRNGQVAVGGTLAPSLPATATPAAHPTVYTQHAAPGVRGDKTAGSPAHSANPTEAAPPKPAGAQAVLPPPVHWPESTDSPIPADIAEPATVFHEATPPAPGATAASHDTQPGKPATPPPATVPADGGTGDQADAATLAAAGPAAAAPALPAPPSPPNGVPAGVPGADAVAAVAQAAATVSPPATAATAPAAPHASPGGQVGQAVSAIHIAPGAAGQVTIHLQPGELGAVQVRIERAHDGASIVTVQVEKAETLRVMQQDLPHLHQALDRAGLPTEARQVTLHLTPSIDGGQTGSFSASADGQRQNTAQRGPSSGSTSTGGTGAGSAAPADDPANRAPHLVWRPAGVNITA